jgi:hypothetical protein
MAGISDALKLERFVGGDNFKRWHTRVAHEHEDLVGDLTSSSSI